MTTGGMAAAGTPFQKGTAVAETHTNGRKRVRFAIRAAPDSEVYVVGTFNDWNPKKNRLTFKDGVYSTMIHLDSGKYEYKFIVNDVWWIDPECLDWVPNGLGSLNSVVVVE